MTDQTERDQVFYAKLQRNRRERLDLYKKGEYLKGLAFWLSLSASALLIITAFVVMAGLTKAMETLAEMDPLVVTKVETVVEEKVIKVPCPPPPVHNTGGAVDGKLQVVGVGSATRCEMHTDTGWVVVPASACPALLQGMLPPQPSTQGGGTAAGG